MKDPNLLQMPSKVGDLIRRAFLAPSDYVWVSKDFAGQELRQQAAMAGERRLIKLLEDDEDVYADTAAFFYKVPYAELRKKKGEKRRDAGKRGVLALSYGAQAGKIAEIFGCTKQAAQKFIDDFYHKLYPGLGKYQETQKKKARTLGYVETILGRRRHLKIDEKTMTFGQINAIERQAINSPIQGSAADQTKLAFVLCARHFRKRGYKSKVRLRIHDELVFWIHKDELQSTTILQEIDYIMTRCINFGIRMDTTTEIYTSKWGEKGVLVGPDGPTEHAA
jgi:DNA polymerase-1